MYERAQQIIELALSMQGGNNAASWEDIRAKFGVSRRTAERMRAAAERVLPALPRRISLVSAEQLAHLAAATELLRDQARPEAVVALKKIDDALRDAYGAARTRQQLDREFEALTELEGLAARPGPRARYDPEIRQTLREAIRRGRVVWLEYRMAGTGQVESRPVEPDGFLHGTRSYLAAYDRKAKRWRTFRLSNVLDCKASGEKFVRDPDFSLEKFAGRSFGALKEEPFNVVWKFSPAAAASARECQFHQNQTIEELDDGSLVVRFRAGGAQEIPWELYSWVDTVDVIEPVGFWERLEWG